MPDTATAPKLIAEAPSANQKRRRQAAAEELARTCDTDLAGACSLLERAAAAVAKLGSFDAARLEQLKLLRDLAHVVRGQAGGASVFRQCDDAWHAAADELALTVAAAKSGTALHRAIHHVLADPNCIQ
jgi:hypothetical protein